MAFLEEDGVILDGSGAWWVGFSHTERPLVCAERPCIPAPAFMAPLRNLRTLGSGCWPVRAWSPCKEDRTTFGAGRPVPTPLSSRIPFCCSQPVLRDRPRQTAKVTARGAQSLRGEGGSLQGGTQGPGSPGKPRIPQRPLLLPRVSPGTVEVLGTSGVLVHGLPC